MNPPRLARGVWPFVEQVPALARSFVGQVAAKLHQLRIRTRTFGDPSVLLTKNAAFQYSVELQTQQPRRRVGHHTCQVPAK